MPSVRQTTRLTVSLFGLTALIATSSAWVQLMGLYGAQGIVPLAERMAALERSGVPFFQVPTVLWFGASDGWLHGVLAMAVGASLFLAAGLLPRVAALVLFVSWLSLVQVGAPFFNFQWDILLLEASVVVALWAPSGWRPFLAERPWVEPSTASRFALAILSCKVTLGSGVVKLASGDPAWRDLTALTYHWWTQPLPTWSSVLAHQWPLGVQKALCAMMFVLELVPPVLVFGPRSARLVGSGGLIAMQAALFAAGNYSYFNLLTLVLAIALLDDRALAALGRPWGLRETTVLSVGASKAPPKRQAIAALGGWMLVVAYGLSSVAVFAHRWGVSTPLDAVVAPLTRFHLVNAYGAFAVMTKNRVEIVVEGSGDGKRWVPYEFRYKPGRVDRRPVFVAPWQPRLDWQMWFASLGSCSDNPWLLAFQQRLLSGSADVVGLLEANPFPQAPPRYLRSTSYEYRFAALRAQNQWWERTEVGAYCPVVTLREGRLQQATEIDP